MLKEFKTNACQRKLQETQWRREKKEDEGNEEDHLKDGGTRSKRI
jgi:hypothetical protein